MSQLRIRRLEGNPIIRPRMDDRMGGNVQGPSLIRVPDWVRAPLGRYYLYFADHKGSYIRLAVADALTGPWRIHRPGALTLADSGFPPEPMAIPAGGTAAQAAGTLPGMAPPGTAGIPDALADASTPHIASPDVHVDPQQRRIVMYFHGLESYRRQVSRVALSSDGLHFQARPAPRPGDLRGRGADLAALRGQGRSRHRDRRAARGRPAVVDRAEVRDSAESLLRCAGPAG
jgi:hypothetical protein